MSSPANIAGYCRVCGKALEEGGAVAAEGNLYCKEHAPAEHAESTTEHATPYSAPPASASQPSPVLAFFLGMIPGVGAVYNGQYVKGLFHVLILGLMISILSNGEARGYEPLFGILIPSFWTYMCIEAYHTAKKRRAGEAINEASGVLREAAPPARFPVGPIVLIAVGTLFLLDNLNVWKIGRLLHNWPVFLIAYGVYMLYERMKETKNERP
jgi:cell wall-active antibiotic response 4TMS protein YvqF